MNALPVKNKKSPLIMGVLKVASDSFPGDPLAVDAFIEVALTQAIQMAADGADMIELCAAKEDENRYLLPVIRAIRAKMPAMTLGLHAAHPAMARAAVEAGVSFLNNAEGFLPLAVEKDASLILRCDAKRQVRACATVSGSYPALACRDIVREVKTELQALVDEAEAAGASRTRLILDPGIGIEKTPEENTRLMNELDALKSMGIPLLLSAPRKEVLEEAAGVAALGALRGADILRVHDVRFMSRVARMTAALAA